MTIDMLTQNMNLRNRLFWANMNGSNLCSRIESALLVLLNEKEPTAITRLLICEEIQRAVKAFREQQVTNETKAVEVL